MVAQNTILSEWFGGKILSIATGLNQTVNNLGLTGSYYLTGVLFDFNHGNYLPFFAGFLSCLISFLANLVYCYYNGKYKKIRDEEEEEFERGEEVDEHNIDFSLIWDLNKTYFLCVLVINLQSITYYGFTGLSSECMIKRFGFTLVEGEKILMLMPLISVFSIPFYSYIALKKGLKTVITAFGNFLGVISFYYLLGIKEKKSSHIYVPVFLLSQFLSIHGACGWTNICLSVRKRAVAIAFGMALFTGNVIASIFPYFIGGLIKSDNYEGYQKALVLFFKIAAFNFIASLVLLWRDLRQGGVLFYPENSEIVKRLIRMREGNGGVENEIREIYDFNGEEKISLSE